MDAFMMRVCASAGSHMACVISALYDGVAFRVDGKTYEIFSHEGDPLGSISTADLNFAINLVRRMGREVGKLQDRKYDNVTRTWAATYEPAFSFAWVGWHPIDFNRAQGS
jgi:hypothetical protein